MTISTKKLIALLLAWGVAAALAGYWQLLAHLPPFIVPAVIACMTTAFSVSLARVGWLREAAASIGVRVILAAHLIRFLGFYFLWLHAHGRIPVEFAQRAGWGDVAAAGGALLLLFWPEGKGFRRAVFWWNIVGAADLLLAVGTAGWLNLTRPGSVIELSHLPLALVPLCFVPVLLSSHIFLLRQQIANCRREELEAPAGRPITSSEGVF